MENRFNDRAKKLKWNSISSLVYQITVILGGFILPRLILKEYGSEVNGIVNSVTQFLSVVSFLDMGVGSVVASTLYKPIAENNIIKINKVITSATRFYKKIAYVLLIYMIILMIIYPLIVKGNFSSVYIATLIFAIGLNSFVQYFFGVVDLYFLTAMQMSYIQFNIQTITYIINLLVSVFLVLYVHSPIQIIKITTSIIFLFRPVFIRLYINRKIKINRREKYSEEPIKQKWNGIAQHISFIVMQNTDVIVLSIFSSLKEVSIYSVYNLVVSGVKALVTSSTNGIESIMGEMYAKDEKKTLYNFLGFVEWTIHNIVIFIFGCTSVLIVPFICVYTASISDANYNQPLFAILITLANAAHCLRLPYNMIIQACGHYKQTQNSYFISAGINIVVSILLVNYLGLIGVSIGTFFAMMYHTVCLARYEALHLVERPIRLFLKQFISDIIIYCVAFTLTYNLKISDINYFAWIKLAILVVMIWCGVVIIINWLIYPDMCKKLIQKVRK